MGGHRVRPRRRRPRPRVDRLGDRPARRAGLRGRSALDRVRADAGGALAPARARSRIRPPPGRRPTAARLPGPVGFYAVAAAVLGCLVAAGLAAARLARTGPWSSRRRSRGIGSPLGPGARPSRPRRGKRSAGTADARPARAPARRDRAARQHDRDRAEPVRQDGGPGDPGDPRGRRAGAGGVGEARPARPHPRRPELPRRGLDLRPDGRSPAR